MFNVILSLAKLIFLTACLKWKQSVQLKEIQPMQMACCGVHLYLSGGNWGSEAARLSCG